MESLLKCVWVTLYAFTHYYYGSRGLQTTSDDPGEFGAGKLFIFAFPSHNRNYNPRLLITTWSEQTVYVTITQFSKLPEKKQVDRKNFIDVSFEPLNGNEIEYQNSSIIVQASDYVYVYATAIVAILERYIRSNYVLADGFLAIPAERLGTEYYVASWAPSDWPSTFVVTALENATNVLIHFPGGSRGDKHVRLHPYETFYCMDDDYDLTGTLIKSDQPVAVISSHSCACVPNAQDDVCNFMACAPLSEMTLPISSSFGTYFVVSAFPTYSLGFILRIVGSEVSTKVEIRSNLDHHNTTRTIGPGTFTDLKVVSNTSTMVILASKPVLVVQYPICTNTTEGSSGSFMVEIPPTDQFSSDVIFPIHNGYDPVQNMVSITSKCDDQAYLELNDSPLYLVKGYNLTIDDWCIFHAEVSDGLHTVKHSGKNDILFFVLVYGFLLDDYDGGIAFGYAAARGHPGTVPSSIKPPHTTHRWTTDVSTTTEHGTTSIPPGGIQWLIIEIAIPCAGFAVVVMFILVYYLICRCCCSAGGYERMAVVDDDNDEDVTESSSTPGQHDPGPEIIGSAGCVSSLPSYKMDSVPRGLCVIINNMNFRDASWQRDGSDKDAGRLIRIFGRFHFKIMIKNDLTAVQMLRSLKQISEINHNPYDAFVCCILTHGQFKAELAGTDMRFIKTQQLLNLFTSDKCPSLAGKPKVFFIQACEGRLLQTTVNSRIVRDNPPASGPAIELIHRSPTHADFLLGYSTVSGCSAYRNTTEGSWYIMALVEALEKHSTEEVMTVLQAVNEIMRMRQPNADIEYESEEFSQIAAPVMSLSKKLYFATLTTDETSLETTQDSVVAVDADIPSDLEDES